MAVEIIFPRVDMDMTSGRFSRWLVADGTAVGKGDPLFEIETDKAAMEIESPASGILRGPTAAEGQEIPVGASVGWIVPDGEAWHHRPEPAPVPASSAEAPPEPMPGAVAPPAGLLRATPLARREARRLLIDLDQVTGSGPRGRIVARDLDGRPASAQARHRMHRQWTGDGHGTPLVFLHGFAADLTGWRPLCRGLEATHRILAIDLPGHGRSPAGVQPSLADLVECVQQVLEEEHVSGCILIGHSLGGAVALGLVDSGAADIRALCLLAPAGLGPEIDGAFLAGIARATCIESLAPWLDRLVADPALITPAFARASLQKPGDAARAYRQRLAEALFPDGTQAISMRPMLRRLTMPVKLVWGSLDRIIPISHSVHLPGQIGLHRLDAGHMPHLEAPRLLAGLIAELARSAAG